MSLKDINGKQPEIYLCTTNRSAGKTTYFERYLVKRFLKYGEKFLLLYRFVYEIDNVADKFFKDIQRLFFPQYTMTSRRDRSGAFHHLFLHDGEKEIECGYACALNSSDQIKKNSHLLSDVSRMFFDEFQSESNHYCDDEVTKFMSIHTTVARGGGQFVRYVPVIMCSNPVSIINPYYVAMHIPAQLRDNTRYLRGDGFVLEHGHNDAAAAAQAESGFMRAFSGSSYVDYTINGEYLNDNMAFIERPIGQSKYISTLIFNDVEYGVRIFNEAGVIYCDNSPDKTYPVRIAVTADDHNTSSVMARQFRSLIMMFRYYFERGSFRFKDLNAKQAILTLLSY